MQVSTSCTSFVTSNGDEFDSEQFFFVHFFFFDFSSSFLKLNSKFVNNGTKGVKFRDTVIIAIELTCNIAIDGAHAPRECFLRTVTILLQGWGVGEDRIARKFAEV